jgi:hypothetical protein
MFTAVLTALGGAAGLAALLSPVLVHLTQRRAHTQTENTSLIDQLQQERDDVVARLDQRDATIAALWAYVYELRYWMVKGAEGEPPTMPPTLTVAAVRARVGAP